MTLDIPGGPLRINRAKSSKPLLIVVIQAWKLDSGGVNVLSLILAVKKMTLDVPGGPLSEIETGLVQKKWSESGIAGVVC